MRWGSVRARTTLAATLVVGFALVIGAVGLLLTLRHELILNQDAVARAHLRELAARAADESLPRVIADVGDDGIAQVLDSHSHVLGSTSGLVGAGPISDASPATGAVVTMTLSGVQDDQGTESYRVVASTAQTPSGPVRVFAGASLESVSETVAGVRRSLLEGIPVLLAIVAVTTWWLTGRALRPVEAIRREVATISELELARRVPRPRSDDEVARLAATMNEMLDRLERAASRQRDFVADASHDLQSPLAAVRTELEVSLLHPDTEQWESVARGVLADTIRMEALVADLLFLARTDADALPRDTTSVDLDVLVGEEVARLVAPSVTIDLAAVSAAPVRGDREDLRRLVRNLLENAVQHARHHVWVTTTIDSTAEAATFVVRDDGDGVDPADRSTVFDRFTRGDDARTRSRAGTGLGLSIVRSVAVRHGGTARLVDSDGGACFEVRLPLAQPTPA